jgi:hypothetical protein
MIRFKKVSTEADFRKAVQGTFNDIVILMEPFETYEPIEVKRKVELMCDPNAYIKYNDYNHNQDHHSLFRVQHNEVIFNRFNLKGGGKVLTNSHVNDGVQSGVKFEAPGGVCQFINGKIEGFNWGSIWAFDSDHTIISHNTLIGPGAVYFNYGAWLGGRGGVYGQEMYFIKNIVSGVRHAVGASGHPNSYWATGNIVLDTIKQAFDRHSGDTPGIGGLITNISGNTIMNPDRYAFSINNPMPNGCFTFSGNNLTRGIEKPVGELTSIPLYEGQDTMDIKIYNNIYSINNIL